MQDDQQPNTLEKEVETPATLPKGTRTGLPLHVVLSLLRPDELEKLRNYISAYLIKRSCSAARCDYPSCRHAKQSPQFGENGC